MAETDRGVEPRTHLATELFGENRTDVRNKPKDLVRSASPGEYRRVSR